MAFHVFGVEVERNAEADEFFLEASARASGPGLHSYFAQWIIARLPGRSCAWVVSVNSGWPDAWKIAAAMALLPLFFTGLRLTWWVVPGLVMWAFSFLSSVAMRYLTLRVALRRAGYDGRIRRLGSAEVLRRLVEVRSWARKRK